MKNAISTILAAIRPTEPEPLVTYTIPNGAGGNIYVKMPRIFADLGDDFGQKASKECNDLVNRFYDEFRVLFVKGGTECDRVIRLFAEAWSYESYYKFLLEYWLIQEDHYQKESEEANVSQYWDGVDWEKVGWCQNKLEETRILIFKAKAALYFIYKTKSIIKPLTPNVSASAGTSTDGEKKGKGGRTKNPDIAQRNATIYADFIRYTVAENKTTTDAYNRLAKNYKQSFTGDIKAQIRRIVREQKRTQTDTN